MLNKYQKKLMSGLAKYHNYIIEELNDEYGNSEYVLKREKEDGIDFIIFLDDEKNENVLVNQINSKYFSNNLNIFKIIFKSKYTQEDKYSPNDTLVYDMSKNKIIYFDDVTSEIALEIADIIQKNDLSKYKNKKPIVTYILIGINIIFFIISVLLSESIFDININVLIFLGAKVNELILNGEYYRFITCMFLHGGILHITLNMYALYAVGPLIEIAYGKLKYLIIYFVSGILSSLLSFLFSNSVSIGASGAIFGLLGASLVLSIKMKERGRKFKKNILSVIAINIFLGLSMPNIDNFGHLGGLIGGTISSLIATANLKQK